MKHLSLAVWAAVVLLLWPTSARADLFGADVPVLSGILIQAAQTVASINESLKTARQSYEEFRRMADYADEAAHAYQEFSQLNAQMFSGDLQGVFDQAFPEVASIRAEAERLSAGGRWAESNGEFRRLIHVCLRVGQCAEVRAALSFRQTREALSAMFGAAPEALRELQAADDEAAVSIAASTVQEGRGTVVRDYAAELMRQCQQDRASGSQRGMASCQAAAAAAAIADLENGANLADTVSQGNRLQALELLMKSQERKRELQEALERRDQLLEGAKHLSDRPPRVESQGFDLLEGMSQ